MARWTGSANITAVLAAAEAWKSRCFIEDGSIFTDRQLWTASNLQELYERHAGNPIEGGGRDFLDKLREQLNGATSETLQLAAEVIWLLFLFPSASTMKPSTKRETIQTIWGWSGEELLQSQYLDDDVLGGVGHPGTAYNTHRPAELAYLLRVAIAFKALSSSDRTAYLRVNDPWPFVEWVDAQDGSERRLFRNALLYFTFPDHLERNLSRSHREQIYEAFKTRLPEDERLKAGKRRLIDYDKAILKIRRTIEEEQGTKEVDFYRDNLKPIWFASYRETSSRDFTSWLNSFLIDKGLQLNQSGRDVRRLDEKRNIDPQTGFWENASFVTSKPPRWLIHFDATSPELRAAVPPFHRAGCIGFANTKGGNSGALTVRVLPVFKLGERFEVADQWEWWLLFCFPGGLEPGSSGEAFENFDPATGVLTYLKRSQPYILAALLGLNAPDETLTFNVNGTAREIGYREATEALVKLVKVGVESADG